MCPILVNGEKGIKLQKGLVIAIEPMINLGTKAVRQAGDGWTIFTKDLLPSAHYEHTVAVKEESGECLSDHSLVHEAEKNNP